MTVTIRKAEPQDRQALIDLYQALNRHEDGVTGDRRTGPAAAAEQFKFTKARLADSGGLFLVAQVDGKVVGLLTLTFEEGERYVRPELRAHAHIIELVVDEAWRRRGIARALMAAAESLAAGRGHTRLTISVMAGNREAEAAYDRQGFRPLAHDLIKTIALSSKD